MLLACLVQFGIIYYAYLEQPMGFITGLIKVVTTNTLQKKVIKHTLEIPFPLMLTPLA